MKENNGILRPFSNEERKRFKTRFPVVTLPFFGAVALGNGTQYNVAMSMVGELILVSIIGYGSYTFSYGQYCGHLYVSEKLGIANACDARAVADLIESQVGESREYEDQAQYHDCFCTMPKRSGILYE